jgi:excinuclease ABC subunit C
MLPPVVLEKLDALPANPGVYLFKDKKGTVVYVGKAKSLRARVRSYFQASGSDNRYFIPILQTTIGDLETRVTSTEKEAMILENNLIKEHQPRYNIKLRDDKDYLSLRLMMNAPWPRLDVVRRPDPDGARYFGPYHSATAARRTLHLINKHFQLRTCSDTEMSMRKRPCLQFQIKRCPAPCVYEVDRAWYGEQVDSVAKFLDWRHDELSRELIERMNVASQEMRFELAAVYRDQLRAIEKVREEQRIVTVDASDRDVLGLYREGDLVELALLYVRAGKLADVATFSLKNAEIPDEEIIAAFIAQHYVGSIDVSAKDEVAPPTAPIPEEIIVPLCPEGARGIEEVLVEKAGHKVSLVKPQRGAKRDLLDLALDNAQHSFAEKRRQSDDVKERLTQLQERLRLPTLPRRIECCDISHLGGGDTVGAIVAMKDGVPDKKHYRTFHVRGRMTASEIAIADEKRSASEPPRENVDPVLIERARNVARSEGSVPLNAGDDYGAMYEVLARRFRRSLKAAQEDATARAFVKNEDEAIENEKREDERERAEWDLPDLFVVDGGRGQLAVATAAAHDLGLHSLPIVALAKEKENVMGELLVDRVYIPGQKNPIALKSHTASLFFLARVRDEAHRFSNRAREKLGKGRRFKSVLDDVAGIGPKTKKALLVHLGTVAAVQSATDAQLVAVPGVQSRHIAALRKAFGPSRATTPNETAAPDDGKLHQGLARPTNANE